MLKLNVEGLAVTIFEPFEDFEGVKVDFRIVLIELNGLKKKAEKEGTREEITEVMKEVINRYQVSPFTSCFVISEKVIGIYFVVGFIRAIMDYQDAKLTVKHLEWTAVAEVYKVPGGERLSQSLRQALQEAFNITTTVECIWRWDWQRGTKKLNFDLEALKRHKKDADVDSTS